MEKPRIIYQSKVTEKSESKPVNKKYSKAIDVPDIIVRDRDYDKTQMIFDSPDDFNDFYKNHADEIEKETTTALNRLYKIPGYTINRKTVKAKDDGSNQKVIELRRNKLVPKLQEETRIRLLEDKVEKMTEAINELGEQMSALIKSLIERNE